MGTWDIHTFDNDNAADWLYDLQETDDISLLQNSLQPDLSDYLEAPDGETILAAAEIICAIDQGPRHDLPEEATAWVNAHRELEVAALKPLAAKMIARVLADDSELKELWEENEELFDHWLADVRDLKLRLEKPS